MQYYTTENWRKITKKKSHMQMKRRIFYLSDKVLEEMYKTNDKILQQLAVSNLVCNFVNCTQMEMIRFRMCEYCIVLHKMQNKLSISIW